MTHIQTWFLKQFLSNQKVLKKKLKICGVMLLSYSTCLSAIFIWMQGVKLLIMSVLNDRVWKAFLKHVKDFSNTFLRFNKRFIHVYLNVIEFYTTLFERQVWREVQRIVFSKYSQKKKPSLVYENNVAFFHL